MSLIAIALGAAIQLAAAGDIYKCPNAAGKVEFRDRPCDGAVAGEKIKPKDNSVGTGSDITTIRAQDAEFKARQVAKQKAADKANAEAYAAGERQWQQERAHQDSQAIADAIRDANNPYPPGYQPYLLPEQRKKVIVEIVPAKKPNPPPSVPAK
jgi:hypothetical protein